MTDFLYLRSQVKNKQLSRTQKRHTDRQICHQNMLKIMQRADYNLMYRESLDLNDSKARERLFGMITDSHSLSCPSGGVYSTTEYGWVYCSVHGRSPVPKYE